MKPFVALLVATYLFACAEPTPEQKIPASDAHVAEQAYARCKSKADASPEARRLSESFVLGQNKNVNYLDKIANESYATKKQIADLENYRAVLKICRDNAVLDLQSFDKEYAQLVSDYFTSDDKITAEVVNKKITIGEANKKVTKSEYAYSLKGYDLNN